MSVRNILKSLQSHAAVFSNKSFWAFFGTGLIVSVAYMDPGNWGTSISAGAQHNFDLLWVVWMASGMAMLFQYLSGKMGIAGHGLADVIRLRWKNKAAVLAYWLLAEIAVLATDLAEFLGIAVALNLLFGIPLLPAALIAMLDVGLLVVLTRKSFRPLEYAFILFVSVIGLGYVYELFITKPDVAEVLAHSVTPILGADTILLAVGIIGATVMPHALFVHSWLLKNKAKQFARTLSKADMLTFHIADNVFSLIIAGFINAAILIMAAAAFYQSGLGVATIDEAYRTLAPLFGEFSATVFGIALLAAGISSSITGTLAGQSIMESLTDFRLSLLARRLITRVINVIPLLVAIFLNIEPLDIMVQSQVALSLLIPLPLLPLIYYSADQRIMGRLANHRLTTAVAALFALVILAFNAYLLADTFGFLAG
ncbi:MAG: Nramp family divalent metal transporter [Candidatus Micrarchaeota archaeon]|nr:Nramp family divalent metal transporter [Candidatus Micrarchaeota archaeon]